MKREVVLSVVVASLFGFSGAARAGEAKTFSEIMNELNNQVHDEKPGKKVTKTKAETKANVTAKKVAAKTGEQTAEKTPPAANREPAGERLPTVDSNNAATRPSQEALPVAEDKKEEEPDNFTGHWGGVRTKLSDLGLNFALIYKGEFNHVLSNGLSKEGSYLGNVDFRVAVDAEKLMGWKGGSMFFYVLNNHGNMPSERVGDVQITSNIEVPAPTTKLYEAWVQQLAFDDKVSFLVGLHDLNSEFYVTDTSGLFFNSSFALGKELSQTGTNGPSIFPTTAPAIRVRVEPNKSFYAQMGVFNGQSGDPDNRLGTKFRFNPHDGTLIINEFAYTTGKDGKGLYGKYGLGLWNYSKEFDHLTEVTYDAFGNPTPAKASSRGAYFIGEQALSEMTSVFFRYGVASAETNRFGSCLSTGVVFTGLIPSRSKDRFGVGFAFARNGSEYMTAQEAAGTPSANAEYAYEANYRFEVYHGVAIQPDLQYITNPSTEEGRDAALVGAIRLELSL